MSVPTPCVFRAQFGQLQYLVSFVRTMKLLAISVRPVFFYLPWQLFGRETLLYVNEIQCVYILCYHQVLVKTYILRCLCHLATHFSPTFKDSIFHQIFFCLLASSHSFFGTLLAKAKELKKKCRTEEITSYTTHYSTHCEDATRSKLIGCFWTWPRRKWYIELRLIENWLQRGVCHRVQGGMCRERSAEVALFTYSPHVPSQKDILRGSYRDRKLLLKVWNWVPRWGCQRAWSLL